MKHHKVLFVDFCDTLDEYMEGKLTMDATRLILRQKLRPYGAEMDLVGRLDQILKVESLSPIGEEEEDDDDDDEEGETDQARFQRLLKEELGDDVNILSDEEAAKQLQ
jgi:hypothetical protein